MIEQAVLSADMASVGPVGYRVMLGRVLRAAREQAGLDRETVAAECGWHPSKVSRLEAGKLTLRGAELDQLLTLYNTDDEEAERVRSLAREARKRRSYGPAPNWSRQYLGLEEDAVALDIHNDALLPGLAQTEDYARALVKTSMAIAPADVERVVAARMRRQELLRRDNPPDTHMVIGEEALPRAQVYPGQVQRLIELAGMPHVTLQLLPTATGVHAALGTNFIILSTAIGGNNQRWVYTETLDSASCEPLPAGSELYGLTFRSLTINALGERETLARLGQARDAQSEEQQ